MAAPRWRPAGGREEVERAIAASGSVREAASRLGIHDQTLRRWCGEHGVDLSRLAERGRVRGSTWPVVEARPAEELSNEELLRLCRERGIEVMRTPVVEDREVEVEAPRLDGSGSFKVGIVSDTHLGSKYQQLTFLEAAYDWFAREEVAVVVHAGDLTAGADTMHRGMVHELFLHGADEQVDYAVAAYPRREGVTTYVVSGNHDHSHLKEGGTNVVRRIAERRPDIVYLGMSGAHLVIDGIRFYVHHPSGGPSYARSYRLQRLIEQFSPENKPKVLVVGHFHVTAVLESYRNVYGLLAGCFEAQTPYLTGKGVYPEVGFSVLEVVHDERGAVRFRKEWVPFYTPLEKDWGRWS